MCPAENEQKYAKRTDFCKRVDLTEHFIFLSIEVMIYSGSTERSKNHNT